MKFPKHGSRTYEVLKWLNENGPKSYDEIQARFKTVSRAAMGATGTEYSLIRDGKTYAISEVLSKWFAGTYEQPKEIGPIVPTRTFTKPKELKGYAASLTRNLREPIRDIGFISASPAASVYWSE